MRPNLGRSTRSIYLGLACISLTLHLLLALFCLSVLQTACVLPASSSPSSSQEHRLAVHASSASAASPSRKLPTSPQNEKRSGVLSHRSGNVLNESTESEKKLIRPDDEIQEVKGHSKLEALFRHPLYNLPRPQPQEDDWLLRVKTDEDAEDTRSEEEEEEWEDAVAADSKW